LVMNVINGSPSKRLADLCPRQVYMGLPMYDPFKIIYNPNWSNVKKLSVSSEEIKTYFAELQEDLMRMHYKVEEAHKLIREKSYRYFKKKYNFPDVDPEGNIVPDIDFSIGDFVLCAIPNTKKSKKLEAIWRGPYKVTGLVQTDSEYGTTTNRIYELEHLVTGAKIQSHAMRIKFYADKELDKYVNMNQLNTHITSQEKTTFELERLVSHRFDNKTMKMQVECKWQGFGEEENTWEPIHDIFNDAPQMVKHYLQNLGHEESKKLKKYLS
jgi:hypothetical protein